MKIMFVLIAALFMVPAAKAKNTFVPFDTIKCTAKRVVSESTSGTGPLVNFEIRQSSDCRSSTSHMEIFIDGKTHYKAGFGQACDEKCSTILVLDAGNSRPDLLSTQEYFDSTFEDVQCPSWPPSRSHTRAGDTWEVNGRVCIHYVH